MIVIDVGCAKHGSDESIPHLVHEYQPEFLYGFDPAAEARMFSMGKTMIHVLQRAAWTYEGHIGFKVAGLGGHVEAGATSFPCFDLARFILRLVPEKEPIILKMDAEGAEYVLLPHLCEHDADLRLKLAIVEFHCEFCGLGGNGRHREGCTVDRDWWIKRRESVEGAMRCEVAEWNL